MGEPYVAPFTETTRTVYAKYFHKQENCVGPCPIHAPSQHAMVKWPLHYRFDRDIFERVCEHGTGHPDPDSLNYILRHKGVKQLCIESVHGCCGCCDKKKNEDSDGREP